MAYFAPLFLIVIAYLLGSLLQAVLREEKTNLPETVLVGTLCLLLLWEAVILPSIKLLASFQIVCRVYSGLLLFCMLLAFVFAGKRMKKQLAIDRLYELWPLAGAVGVLAIQIFFVFMLEPNREYDFTVETVNTTLVSDLIYENHPGMGSTFLYGITFRGKLVTLPLLYAYLVQMFGGPAATMVYRAVPIWMLALNALSYWNLGSNVFLKDEKEWHRCFFFVMGIGLLNVFGSFAKNCIFYYQMYCGFKGETFIYGILMPLTLSLCSHILMQKELRKIFYLLMVLLSSLTVTDYQKGLVPLLVSIAVCLLLLGGYRIRRWIRCRK